MLNNQNKLKKRTNTIHARNTTKSTQIENVRPCENMKQVQEIQGIQRTGIHEAIKAT